MMHDGNFGFSLTSATVLVHIIVPLWVAVLAVHFKNIHLLCHVSCYVGRLEETLEPIRPYGCVSIFCSLLRELWVDITHEHE